MVAWSSSVSSFTFEHNVDLRRTLKILMEDLLIFLVLPAMKVKNYTLNCVCRFVVCTST